MQAKGRLPTPNVSGGHQTASWVNNPNGPLHVTSQLTEPPSGRSLGDPPWFGHFLADSFSAAFSAFFFSRSLALRSSRPCFLPRALTALKA